MKLAVVIAAWDERQNIDPLVRRLDTALDHWRGSRELIFVVEGEDGTREALEALRSEAPDLRVIYRREPRGLGEAFRTGFAAVSPEAGAVVTLDADLNHQPEEIPRLVAALQESGADVIVGSRDLPESWTEGIPAWKRGLSRAVNRALSRLHGLEIEDKTSGFRVYRAEALRRLEIRASGFSFLADLLVQAHEAGMVVREVPIHFVYRSAGRSKLPFVRTSAEYFGLVARAAVQRLKPAESALVRRPARRRAPWTVGAPGERDLRRLLAGLEPALDRRAHLFLTVPPGFDPEWASSAFARVLESEGVTVVAAERDVGPEAPATAPRWAKLTLGVPSSLEAVGLIAAVAERLAGLGIPVNPISGFHHDHLLVPWERRQEALDALHALADEARRAG